MKRVLLALVLAAGLLLAPFASGADAHQQPYDSGIQTEHNLCVIMRPYGVGTITGHYRLSGTNRQCLVCIGDSHYGYRVVYSNGQWSGPHGTTYVGAC